jgi:hypothetical protein
MFRVPRSLGSFSASTPFAMQWFCAKNPLEPHARPGIGRFGLRDLIQKVQPIASCRKTYRLTKTNPLGEWKLGTEAGD